MDKKLEKYLEWYNENNRELAEMQEAKKKMFAEIRKIKDMRDKLAKWITEAGGEVPEQMIIELDEPYTEGIIINEIDGTIEKQKELKRGEEGYEEGYSK